MERYKKFLKTLLSINIVFIFIAALLGYQLEDKYIIKEVSKPIKASKIKDEKEINKVVPLGKIIGVYVNTNGILVIDTGEVTDINGKRKTPAKYKLLPGDYILKLNGEIIKSKKELISKITECNGKDLIFTLKRKNMILNVKINPVKTDTDVYKVGIWVRDDLQGLGTMTYVQDKDFAALGHSINDADTGKILNISGGNVYEADIYGIEKGIVGSPGEIEGMISYQKENIVGDVDQNYLYGIYGKISTSLKDEIKNEKGISIAERNEIKIGKAYIQSYVSGKKDFYEIDIINIHQNSNGDTEMEIRITDSKLIHLTGGIIQGMSGSPIIQNNKLIGAVTHVFVDDPKRGYAISIENMMKPLK